MAKSAAKATDPNSDIAEMSFEHAMKALEDIVAQLESGRVDLEQSIAIYERGAALKRHCETKLKAAEARVEQIVQTDGGVRAEAAALDGAP